MTDELQKQKQQPANRYSPNVIMIVMYLFLFFAYLTILLRFEAVDVMLNVISSLFNLTFEFSMKGWLFDVANILNLFFFFNFILLVRFFKIEFILPKSEWFFSKNLFSIMCNLGVVWKMLKRGMATSSLLQTPQSRFDMQYQNQFYT